MFSDVHWFLHLHSLWPLTLFPHTVAIQVQFYLYGSGGVWLVHSINWEQKFICNAYILSLNVTCICLVGIWNSPDPDLKLKMNCVWVLKSCQDFKLCLMCVCALKSCHGLKGLVCVCMLKAWSYLKGLPLCACVCACVRAHVVNGTIQCYRIAQM